MWLQNGRVLTKRVSLLGIVSYSKGIAPGVHLGEKLLPLVHAIVKIAPGVHLGEKLLPLVHAIVKDCAWSTPGFINVCSSRRGSLLI